MTCAAKIVETIYAGKDNTFSLQFLRDNVIVSTLSFTGYELHWTDGRVFSNPAYFIAKAEGIVEIAIGQAMTDLDIGKHTAYMVTIDPENTQGVRWPDFTLWVK